MATAPIGATEAAVIPATFHASRILWALKPAVAVEVTLHDRAVPDMDRLAQDVLRLNGWEPNTRSIAECHVSADGGRVVFVPEPPDEDGYDMPAWRQARDEALRVIQLSADTGQLAVRAAQSSAGTTLSPLITPAFRFAPPVSNPSV